MDAYDDLGILIHLLDGCKGICWWTLVPIIRSVMCGDLGLPRTTNGKSNACSEHVPNERVPTMFQPNIVPTTSERAAYVPSALATCSEPALTEHVLDVFRPNVVRVEVRW